MWKSRLTGTRSNPGRGCSVWMTPSWLKAGSRGRFVVAHGSGRGLKHITVALRSACRFRCRKTGNYLQQIAHPGGGRSRPIHRRAEIRPRSTPRCRSFGSIGRSGFANMGFGRKLRRGGVRVSTFDTFGIRIAQLRLILNDSPANEYANPRCSAKRHQHRT